MSEAPDAAAVAAAAATAAAAAAAAGTKPWYEGASPELIGHIQTKGWHDKPANEAALAAITAHREAEKFIGAPADKIIKLPTDANDEAGWKDVFKRLGAPADPKEYDFSTVKNGEAALDQGTQDFLRGQADALHLSKDAAIKFAEAYIKHGNDGNIATAAERTAKLAEEHKVLDTSWGANKETNLFIARKGAEKLGLTPEHVNELEGVVGYAKIMEALRQVGELAGEAKFIGSGTGPGGSGNLTREQAVARIAELKGDANFAKRYFDGGAPERREMDSLHAVAYSEA
jgi:hypothetical protein